MDPRQSILAKQLISYSVDLKKGEKVLIEATGVDYAFVNALIKEAYACGGVPIVNIYDNKIQREIIKGGGADVFCAMADYAGYRMRDMQAYIGVRGGENALELSDVGASNMQAYSKYYSHPVHHELRVKKTKWVVLRYPTEGMSQQSGMSTEAFRDFYYDVCCLDYSKMGDAMKPLVELINRTDRVRITAKDTDLSFSVKGIGAVPCCGHSNIPDGEVYTAPVRDSVNGHIHFNAPSIENGLKYEDVRLTFKDGKIVDATANFTDEANKIFDTDEGARYVGEFALGVNPYIKKPMGDILFDEKISGSLHFTPGACYDEANNGNISAVHWDLVLIQTPDYGGGEIYFDGVLIRKDGRFVLKALEGLNPENLM